MAVLDYVLEEELSRLQRFLSHLKEDHEKIPKGSVVLKRKSNRLYAYRVFRQGQRVITEYVGPAASLQAAKLGQLIEERRKLAAEIKAVEASIARLQRMIHVG